MNPESKYRLKIVVVAIFLVLLVDVPLFLLAENSLISFDTNLTVSFTWNIIMLITVLYLLNRSTKAKQTLS